MSFLIHDELLRRVLDVNSVPLSDSQMIFFGVRGALPLNLDDLDFDAAHTIGVENVDYVHPRCTFVQWLPADGVLAVFPGSTVPHSTHVGTALPNRGVGVNQLMTGYYDDYRKGVHKAGSPTAHDAFRQTEGRPIRRTQDDLDFDPDDRTELTNPFDNLHAGWCPSVNHPDFASMGCQVVLGFPKCERLGNRPATGPWNVFQRNAYEQEQDRFGYMLIDSRSVQAVAEAGDSPVPRRLRFGSQGALVTRLQTELKTQGFYEGTVDADFGPRTIRAVLAFQVARFGVDSEDGVVGPQTANALGIQLGSV